MKDEVDVSGLEVSVQNACDLIDALRVRAAQAEAALQAKDDELETERIRLAACMTAALGNTRESVAQRIGPDHPYFSASYLEVCKAVDREMLLREAQATLRTQIQQLIDEWRADIPRAEGESSQLIMLGYESCATALAALLDPAGSRRGPD